MNFINQNENINEMKKLNSEYIQSGILTLILTLMFLLFVWNDTSSFNLFISLPFFIILYFLFFSIGSPNLSKWLSEKLNGDIKRVLVLPTFLIVLYFSYIIIYDGNPFKGTVFLFPFFIYFPVIIFTARKNISKKIDWIDFFTLILFLLPTTLVDFEPKTGIPISGGGFDSVYRIVVILTAVYSFVIIRGVDDVGFYPNFKWKHLGIALITWILFYAFAMTIALPLNFMKFTGHDSYTFELSIKIIRKLLTVFLHTAIFEELFFRGLLQNMLSKRIKQTKEWIVFWKWGLVILFIVSLITGYSMDGNFEWLPTLVTVILFLTAYLIEKKKFNEVGTYTALVITSVIFGLVHYHSGSIIFVALASIGGWAYGYTYLKTKNIFYAALVHSLVNNSAFILGLSLLK